MPEGKTVKNRLHLDVNPTDREQDEDDGAITIGSPLVPPTLTFARVPEGKTVKNRLHLDVNPTDRDQDEEVRRLLDLGRRP